MVHFHLDYSWAFRKIFVEGDIPFLRLVGLDVGKEEAGGERPIDRDSSPVLCSGPSSGLWGAVLLIN